MSCSIHKQIPRRVEILDVPFHAVGRQEALDALITLAQGDRCAYAVTANVDHVVRFHRRPDVRHLYSQADLVLADGKPLVWAARLVGTPLPERVAGSDLFPLLCAEAETHNLSVYLLGGAEDSARQAAEVLQARHPRLRIAGTHCPLYGFESDPNECGRIARRINAAKSDILFVGLGSPKQEHWIVEHRAASGAKLSIGVGISFSFLSGQVRRAPRWMQRSGFEWAHRLCQEPRRLWKRYIVEDAVFFPLVLRAFARRLNSRASKSTPD